MWGNSEGKGYPKRGTILKNGIKERILKKKEFFFSFFFFFEEEEE